jgi:RNA-binding protein
LERLVKELKGAQKRHLRGLAHAMKPLVTVGQKGMGPALVKALDEALETHELIKLKFNEFKEKDEKKVITAALSEATRAQVVGVTGHTVIFYREQPDPERRRILIPE